MDESPTDYQNRLAVDQWLCELRETTENECMCILQSKSISPTGNNVPNTQLFSQTTLLGLVDAVQHLQDSIETEMIPLISAAANERWVEAKARGSNVRNRILDLCGSMREEPTSPFADKMRFVEEQCRLLTDVYSINHASTVDSILQSLHEIIELFLTSKIKAFLGIINANIDAAQLQYWLGQIIGVGLLGDHMCEILVELGLIERLIEITEFLLKDEKQIQDDIKHLTDQSSVSSGQESTSIWSSADSAFASPQRDQPRYGQLGYKPDEDDEISYIADEINTCRRSHFENKDSDGRLSYKERNSEVNGSQFNHSIAGQMGILRNEIDKISSASANIITYRRFNFSKKDRDRNVYSSERNSDVAYGNKFRRSNFTEKGSNRSLDPTEKYSEANGHRISLHENKKFDAIQTPSIPAIIVSSTSDISQTNRLHTGSTNYIDFHIEGNPNQHRLVPFSRMERKTKPTERNRSSFRHLKDEYRFKLNSGRNFLVKNPSAANKNWPDYGENFFKIPSLALFSSNNTGLDNFQTELSYGISSYEKERRNSCNKKDLDYSFCEKDVRNSYDGKFMENSTGKKDLKSSYFGNDMENSFNERSNGNELVLGVDKDVGWTTAGNDVLRHRSILVAQVLRALATICCVPNGISRLVNLDGIECITQALCDRSLDIRAKAESAGVLAQVYMPSPPAAASISLQASLLEQSIDIIEALTDLCKEADDPEIFLLSAAALSNLTSTDPLTCDYVIQFDTINALIHAYNSAIANSVFAWDQITSIISNVSTIGSYTNVLLSTPRLPQILIALLLPFHNWSGLPPLHEMEKTGLDRRLIQVSESSGETGSKQVLTEGSTEMVNGKTGQLLTHQPEVNRKTGRRWRDISGIGLTEQPGVVFDGKIRNGQLLTEGAEISRKPGHHRLLTQELFVREVEASQPQTDDRVVNETGRRWRNLSEIEMTALTSTQLKAVEVITRLSSSTEIALGFVQLNCVPRLVELCSNPESRNHNDAILAASLTAVRKFYSLCGSSLYPSLGTQQVQNIIASDNTQSLIQRSTIMESFV